MALAAYFVSERYKQLRRERLFRDDVELKRLFRLESANILILTSTLNEQLAHETGKAKALPSILQKFLSGSTIWPQDHFNQKLHPS